MPTGSGGSRIWIWARQPEYGRPVATLIAARAINTVLLGGLALAVATVLGLSLGTLSGARRGGAAVGSGVTAASVVLISLPPLVTWSALLMVAAATGWLPVGGFPPGSRRHSRS